MDLSEFPSTQSSVEYRSILVNTHGDPIKINLQAVELEGRPKLVRLLKSSGALVVSNAKEAAIILVDSATESGKRLIRTWGHDTSKVVLEHTWARASINVGRPLFAVDNWGGSMTVDDGKPVTIDGIVVDEDELEEVEALVTKSPLPTPRVTPVDPSSQHPQNIVTEHSATKRSESNTSTSCVAGTSLSRPPMAQSILIGTSLSEQPKGDTHQQVPSQSSPPLPPLPPPPAAQPLPYLQPTLFAQQSQSQNTFPYVPFPNQQAYPSTQSQIMPTQTFSQTGFPSQIIHPSHIQSPSLQSQMMQMSPNHTSSGSVNPQNPNLAAIVTMMEVVRHSLLGQNQFPASQSPANSNTPTLPVQPPAVSGSVASAPTFQTNRRLGSPRTDQSLPSSQDRRPNDTATPLWDRGSSVGASEDRSMRRRPRARPSQCRPDETFTPSLSRKRPPAVKPTHPPPKRLRKGKEKEEVTSSDSSDHSEVGDPMDASDHSHSTHSTSPSARPRNIIAHKKPGEIFLSGPGQPLRFFVQVDLHGRHTVVSNIKKNKGRIVNNITDADYLILFSRSDTFQGLLNEAVALGKVPILSAFVADCIEDGALLDEADYVMESFTKVRGLKKGRQNAFSIKVETPETLPPKINAVKSKPSPATSQRKKSTEIYSTPSVDRKLKKIARTTPPKHFVEAKDGSVSSRSPTPPLPQTRQVMKTGKYLFTKEENEYSLRLAKHYLARNPSISHTALVQKIHKKLPHHTNASWVAYIDKKLKHEFEDVRKRANIAKRKRDDEAANQMLSQGTDKSVPSNGHIPDTAEGNNNDNGVLLSGSSRSSQKNLERHDFDVITQFFASGGGDDEDDERVWQELEKHRRCKSASSWPEYYAAHEKEVYARIEELMNERAG